MKEAKNELLQFVGGVIMLVDGLYILSQKVMHYGAEDFQKVQAAIHQV